MNTAFTGLLAFDRNFRIEISHLLVYAYIMKAYITAFFFTIKKLSLDIAIHVHAMLRCQCYGV